MCCLCTFQATSSFSRNLKKIIKEDLGHKLKSFRVLLLESVISYAVDKKWFNTSSLKMHCKHVSCTALILLMNFYGMVCRTSLVSAKIFQNLWSRNTFKSFTNLCSALGLFWLKLIFTYFIVQVLLMLFFANNYKRKKTAMLLGRSVLLLYALKVKVKTTTEQFHFSYWLWMNNSMGKERK